MKFVKCLTQGDCVRACVASMLELNPLMVPDFFEDDTHPIKGWQRVRDFLKPYKLDVMNIAIPAHDLTLSDVLEAIAIANPGVACMLTGMGATRLHMVIIKDGRIIHDPSWNNGGLSGPIPGEFPMWRFTLLTLLTD